MGARGLNQKSKKKQFCRVPHEELTANKWLDSIEKQKRSDLKFAVSDRHTYIHTDIQTDRQNQRQKLIDF